MADQPVAAMDVETIVYALEQYANKLGDAAFIDRAHQLRLRLQSMWFEPLQAPLIKLDQNRPEMERIYEALESYAEQAENGSARRKVGINDPSPHSPPRARAGGPAGPPPSGGNPRPPRSPRFRHPARRGHRSAPHPGKALQLLRVRASP